MFFVRTSANDTRRRAPPPFRHRPSDTVAPAKPALDRRPRRTSSSLKRLLRHVLREDLGERHSEEGSTPLPAPPVRHRCPRQAGARPSTTPHELVSEKAPTSCSS